MLLFLCGKQIRQVIHVETEVGHATSANLIQFKMFGQMRRAMSTQSSELRHFALLASFLCLDKFDLELVIMSESLLPEPFRLLCPHKGPATSFLCGSHSSLRCVCESFCCLQITHHGCPPYSMASCWVRAHSASARVFRHFET